MGGKPFPGCFFLEFPRQECTLAGLMNDAPRLAVKKVQFHVLNMRTRFPFQYGIASLTALPHLFVRAKVEVESTNVSTGLGADGLPPKWFTKNPKTRFEEDIPAFFKVIGHATKTALDAPEGTFFELWERVYQEQSAWAADKGIPPLLANLGVSLVERAVLDALCRSVEIPAHRVLRDNLVGIDLGAIRPELKGMKPDGVLNIAPLDSAHVRHTVGLGDPLTAANVPAGEDLDDGLPYTLEENIRAYGLNYYKIKVLVLIL